MSKIAPYTGSLKRGHVSYDVLRGIWIYDAQCKRNTVEYTKRAFLGWWLYHLKRKKWKRPHCARFDHDKGYSFDNMEMQEQAENNRERNARRGNPCNNHRAVVALTHSGEKLKEFKSKTEAAKFYGVSEKTVYNHCHRRTSNFNNGPISKAREVTFQWAK